MRKNNVCVLCNRTERLKIFTCRRRSHWREFLPRHSVDSQAIDQHCRHRDIWLVGARQVTWSVLYHWPTLPVYCLVRHMLSCSECTTMASQCMKNPMYVRKSLAHFQSYYYVVVIYNIVQLLYSALIVYAHFIVCLLEIIIFFTFLVYTFRSYDVLMWATFVWLLNNAMNLRCNRHGNSISYCSTTFHQLHAIQWCILLQIFVWTQF